MHLIDPQDDRQTFYTDAGCGSLRGVKHGTDLLDFRSGVGRRNDLVFDGPKFSWTRWKTNVFPARESMRTQEPYRK